MNWNALLYDPEGLVKHPVEMGAVRMDVDTPDPQAIPFNVMT
jgi:hypothetical protein